MTPDMVYYFASPECGCSDAEILAYAAMLSKDSPWRAMKQARNWLDVVRDDQVRRVL